MRLISAPCSLQTKQFFWESSYYLANDFIDLINVFYKLEKGKEDSDDVVSKKAVEQGIKH